MKIVEINAGNNGKTGGKKELGAAEKWLFDTEKNEGPPTDTLKYHTAKISFPKP